MSLKLISRSKTTAASCGLPTIRWVASTKYQRHPPLVSATTHSPLDDVSGANDPATRSTTSPTTWRSLPSLEKWRVARTRNSQRPLADTSIPARTPVAQSVQSVSATQPANFERIAIGRAVRRCRSLAPRAVPFNAAGFAKSIHEGRHARRS